MRFNRLLLFDRGRQTLILVVWLAAALLPAQTPETNRPWAYLLLDGSFLLDDCLICGRPTIEVPMRGTFSLRLIDQNSIGSRFAVENISFTAGSRYTVTGSGTFQFGGEVAVLQEMFLQVQIYDGLTDKLCYFTNNSSNIIRSWPMLDITLDQTNGTFTQTFQLRLTAAPVRDLWFSTVTDFAAVSGQATNKISDGDLLSLSGRVVKRNLELAGQLGVNVPAGLDAVNILPGADIAFSLDQDAFSEIFGPLQHGDLLSTKSGILQRNQDLLAAFTPQLPLGDAGLDAVQILDSGEILFSIETNVFSERLGITLGPGDLLSNTGKIVRSNQQLLARFQISDSSKDHGLDVLYIWPNGEIWFSTERGFTDLALGPILAGDLLSDAGYIVFRNADLLQAFAPVNQVSDFGLDALYIVTDAAAQGAPPQFTEIQSHPRSGNLSLAWKGAGRVFQLDWASALPGPFLPLSPILPDLSYQDLRALLDSAQGYYRLRQW
jgi:hypothetical protein